MIGQAIEILHMQTRTGYAVEWCGESWTVQRHPGAAADEPPLFSQAHDTFPIKAN